MSVINPLPEKMWPGVTGIVSATGLTSNASGADYDWFLAEHSELLRHRDKVREIDLLGPASPELLQKVAELPSHTVVLFQLFPQDSNQPAFGVLDALAAVAHRFPTYSILPHIILGRGGIGGASYDPPTDAALAGELAARPVARQTKFAFAEKMVDSDTPLVS